LAWYRFASGVYKGRPASIDAAEVRKLKAEGLGPSQIARTAGHRSRVSVSRACASLTGDDARSARFATKRPRGLAE